MPEISQVEFDILNRSKNLLDKFWNDPDEGMAFKEKVKKFIPDARIPELDILARERKAVDDRLTPVVEENKKLKERLDSWETAQKNRTEETELAQMLGEVKHKFKFTDEGMDKVVARMKEKNNPDAEAAAAWVASQEKKTRPLANSGISPSDMNLYGSSSEDETWKALNLNPDKWAVSEMEKMLAEFEQQDAA